MAALASLLGAESARGAGTSLDSGQGGTGIPGLPHLAPRAKRVIYLHMVGGPAQMDLFDYKPELVRRNGEDLPASVRMGQRLTGMSANQARLPMAGSIWRSCRSAPTSRAGS